MHAAIYWPNSLVAVLARGNYRREDDYFSYFLERINPQMQAGGPHHFFAYTSQTFLTAVYPKCLFTPSLVSSSKQYGESASADGVDARRQFETSNPQPVSRHNHGLSALLID